MNFVDIHMGSIDTDRNSRTPSPTPHQSPCVCDISPRVHSDAPAAVGCALGRKPMSARRVRTAAGGPRGPACRLIPRQINAALNHIGRRRRRIPALASSHGAARSMAGGGGGALWQGMGWDGTGRGELEFDGSVMPLNRDTTVCSRLV